MQDNNAIAAMAGENRIETKQQIINGLHNTIERLLKESADLRRELFEEKAKMSMLSFTDKIELIAKFSTQVQYDDSIPERLVGEQEEFFMQLQNEILPALSAAHRKTVYGSDSSTIDSDRAYFNKWLV